MVVPTRVVVRRATEVLATAGVASPRVDAELLAAHVLGVSRGRLLLADGFGPERLAAYEALVARRAGRVPLQHLTGEAGFGRLTLAVGPGGFVPRPETEALAQWAADRGGRVVVDLCSGTGALALFLAQALPDARVYAVERSPAAAVWLRRNVAARAAAGDRPVTVVVGDATDPATLADLDGTVDLVVCNPPYVPVGTQVPPEVAAHDPPEAVFGGPDGLAVIRPVTARAADLLVPGGWFAVEHDDSAAAEVAAVLRARGRFGQVRSHLDLAGRPRFCTGRREGGRLASREGV